MEAIGRGGLVRSVTVAVSDAYFSFIIIFFGIHLKLIRVNAVS